MIASRTRRSRAVLVLVRSAARSAVVAELTRIPVRGLLPLELRPGMISLLAGKPNPATFPITALSYTTRVPTSSSGEEAKEVTLELSADHLAQGLQYGATSGFPPFVKWLEDLQEREHGRKRSEGWKLTTGLGSQDLLQKARGFSCLQQPRLTLTQAVLALLNPGDAVLVESPVYACVHPFAA
jgi:tryptophan aminotransferase